MNSLLVSTIILIVFTALAAASYWHGETAGLLSILVAWYEHSSSFPYMDNFGRSLSCLVLTRPTGDFCESNMSFSIPIHLDQGMLSSGAHLLAPTVSKELRESLGRPRYFLRARLLTLTQSVGIGIGGEYPAGSVSCSESSGELKSGTRNRWFILFTNTAIDVGFVAGAFIPYVVAAACHNGYYSTQWRTSLGIGVVFPLILLVLRFRLKEPEEFRRNSMAHVKIPYMLVAKFYGFRLMVVAAIWFIYDFSAYPFSIYGASIVSSIYGEEPPLTTVFGWNTVCPYFLSQGMGWKAPTTKLTFHR